MLTWLATLALSALASQEIHIEDGHFKDVQGRVVVLRGINVSGDAKLPPFTPIHDGHVLDPLPELGFNVIRLLFTWEAFEPERGAYNQAYLDYISNVARWAHERGMVTIIDFHQDALSRFLARGCGEGFPEWTLPAGVKHHTPDNGPQCEKWYAIQWLDGDMRTAWQAFYHDENGIRQAYMAMAQRVAAHLSGVPGVIGYDFINEPAGDEANDMSPLYEDMAPLLQAAHPGAILLVEPSAKVVVGLQSGLPKPGFDNAVYAPHFYDTFTRFINNYPGYSLSHAFGNMQKKAREWDAPLFVGEFGIPPTVGNALGYMRTNYDRLDEGFSSSAQWGFTPGWNDLTKDGWNTEDFSITDDHGQLRNNFRPRPYAQRIAGKPVTLVVHETDAEAERSAELTWEHDPRLGQTEMFVPEQRFFAQTPTVQTVGEGLKCRLSGRKLSCGAATAGRKVVRLATE